MYQHPRVSYRLIDDKKKTPTGGKEGESPSCFAHERTCERSSILVLASSSKMLFSYAAKPSKLDFRISYRTMNPHAFLHSPRSCFPMETPTGVRLDADFAVPTLGLKKCQIQRIFSNIDWAWSPSPFPPSMVNMDCIFAVIYNTWWARRSFLLLFATLGEHGSQFCCYLQHLVSMDLKKHVFALYLQHLGNFLVFFGPIANCIFNGRCHWNRISKGSPKRPKVAQVL